MMGTRSFSSLVRRILAIGMVAPSLGWGGDILHVWSGSPDPMPPYPSWSTAAHTIQEAVDFARPGDTVLVTNGVYATGGRPVNGGTVTNPVAIDRPIRVASINGPTGTRFPATGPGWQDGSILFQGWCGRGESGVIG